MSIALMVPTQTMKDMAKSLMNDNSVMDNTFKNTTEGIPTGWFIVLQIINVAIFAYAIYLSFKRNQGFNFLSFLSACCCSICYIVYALAVPVKK